EGTDPAHEPDVAVVESTAAASASPAPAITPEAARTTGAGQLRAQLPIARRPPEATDRALTPRVAAPRLTPVPRAAGRPPGRVGERDPREPETGQAVPASSLRAAAERAVAEVVGEVTGTQRAAVRRLLSDAREQFRPLRVEPEARPIAPRPLPPSAQ